MINKIKQQLNKNINVLVFDEIDSTNLFAKKLGKEDYSDTLIVANSQTSGRGRLGRDFISSKNLGIYMSLLLRTNLSLQDVSKVTCLVGVSIVKVLEKHLDQKLYLKWVNDIYLNDKKICGILTESSINNGKLEYIVIGIGLNLYSQVFPSDVNASSIEDETQILLDKDQLIIEITNQILLDLETINNLKHVEHFRNHMYYKNESVILKLSDKFVEGIIVDINDNFELVVNNKQENSVVTSGEIIKILRNY